MQVSARILGQKYGLTAEEMNRVLVKKGFLQGKPGDYSVTQKGLEYAVEKDFHRGSGGYACYNAYWSTRTYDDSITEVLDVPADLIREVREELAADRAARAAAQAAARAKADADFLEKQAAKKAAQEAEKIAALERTQFIAKWKKIGKISLIVGSIIIVGYCVYKVTPRVKAWCEEHKSDSDEKTKRHKAKED